MEHVHIVKRKSGHTESYDNHKVYASCYAACLNVHLHKEEAEKICNGVTKELDRWVEKKSGEVSSNDIFKEMARVIEAYNEDAAFMYATHRDVS